MSSFSEYIKKDTPSQAYNQPKGFVLINNTPHYIVTFKTYDHLLTMLEPDPDIKHPMGSVFKSKGTDNDNVVRTVILKGSIKDSGEIQGMFFNRTSWDVKGNPFSLKYYATTYHDIIAAVKAVKNGAKNIKIRNYIANSYESH
jgi:hypothetical protein